MDKITVISVVRDWDKYRQCVEKNPWLAGATLAPIDNNEKNESISVCYNRFLNAYDFSKPTWFVFCHEDFQVYEPYGTILEHADKNCLYGPIGVVTRVRFGIYCQWFMQGLIEECSRNGENLVQVGREVPMGTPVDTFDCQCLIVHSSVVERTAIRFDENLTFDLYVEDFCIQAKEHHGLTSNVLPIKCRHWSHSTAKPRYYDQLAYVNKKWPSVCYTGTSSYVIGGGAGLIRSVNAALHCLMTFLKRQF